MGVPGIAFDPALNNFQDTLRQWPDDVGRRVDVALRRGAEARESIRTAADARAYQRRTRTFFWEGIGGLPGDPAAQRDGSFTTHGELEHLGVRITKLTFESLPGVPVTALLYRPGSVAPTNANAQRPGVLFLCGHHPTAKHHPEYHRICLDLALHGVVVLAIDPWGQGERFQYAVPDRDTPLVADGTYEHSYCGLQCFLTGGTVSRYFTWDGVRAVDVLAALPEVDATRIGVTGNSGGGTQTALLMMADDRLAAAMPCTYISGIGAIYHSGLVHDAEQNFVRSLAHGIDHADVLACFAPRPLLVGAVSYDFFPIEAAEESVRRARPVYELLDAAGRIDIVCDDDRHWYTDVLRERAVRFFTRELGGEERYVQRDIPVLPERSLWCMPTGQLYRDRPGTRSVFDLNRDYLAAHRRPAPQSAAEARERLASVLDVPPLEQHPIRPRYFASTQKQGYAAQRVYFFSEPGIAVAGTLLRPRPTQDNPPSKETTPGETTPGERRVWLALLPNGTASDEAALAGPIRLAQQGNLVLVFDPRGRGAVRSAPTNPRMGIDGWLGLEPWLGYVEMLFGQSTARSRVYDVLRAVEFLQQFEAARDSVWLRAEGVAALWGYLAAALDGRIRAAHLTGLLPSWTEVVETRLYDARSISAAQAIPGALQHFDLPDLRQCFAGRDLRLDAPQKVEAAADSLPLTP